MKITQISFKKINLTPKQKKTAIAGVVLVLVFSVLLYPTIVKKSSNTGKSAAESSQSEEVKYRNSDYRFEFNLPAHWRGFSIVMDKWQGYTQGEKGQVLVAEGPQLSFRHPYWRAQEPRQDIPIMIFTLEQWKDMQQDKFHIGAAPINPTELGRNDKYVFALPARYNYAFLEGYEEVEKILEGNPLHPY